MAKCEQFLTLVGGYTGSLYFSSNFCVRFMFVIKLRKQKNLVEKEKTCIALLLTVTVFQMLCTRTLVHKVWSENPQHQLLQLYSPRSRSGNNLNICQWMNGQRQCGVYVPRELRTVNILPSLLSLCSLCLSLPPTSPLYLHTHTHTHTHS